MAIIPELTDETNAPYFISNLSENEYSSEVYPEYSKGDGLMARPHNYNNDDFSN